MTRLKQDTAAEHEAIEAAVPLLRDDLDDAGYVAHLQRMLGFLLPVEDAVVARLPWFSARRRAPAIVRDLVALGGAADVALFDDALFDDDDGAWGCAYVLEGSRLGGQLIARKLAPKFPLALAWLGGDSDRLGQRWKLFQQDAEAAVKDVDVAVSAAKATFNALGGRLRETAPTASSRR